MKLTQSGNLLPSQTSLVFHALNNLVSIEMLYLRSRAACLSRKSLECDGIELKNGRGSFLSFFSYMKETNPFKCSCLLLRLKMSIFISQVIKQCTKMLTFNNSPRHTRTNPTGKLLFLPDFTFMATFPN